MEINIQDLKEGTSKYIKVQSDPNILQASCVGTNLTFWVNENKVGETTDRDLTEGQVGVSVSTFDLKGAEVEFEYLYAEPGNRIRSTSKWADSIRIGPFILSDTTARFFY